MTSTSSHFFRNFQAVLDDINQLESRIQGQVRRPQSYVDGIVNCYMGVVHQFSELHHMFKY